MHTMSMSVDWEEAHIKPLAHPSCFFELVKKYGILLKKC